MFTPLTLLSLFVCCLLVVGFLNRHRKRWHMTLMLTAFTIDLGMVLYLELARGVVESLPGRRMSALLIVHIALSVIVLVLYTVQIVTGIRNAQGRRSSLHRAIPIWFLLARLGNLITSLVIT